jgi:hypothetical protein
LHCTAGCICCRAKPTRSSLCVDCSVSVVCCMPVGGCICRLSVHSGMSQRCSRGCGQGPMRAPSPVRTNNRLFFLCATYVLIKHGPLPRHAQDTHSGHVKTMVGLAGTPINMTFDIAAPTRNFELCFVLDRTIAAPTEVFASKLHHYPNGVEVQTCANSLSLLHALQHPSASCA